MESELSFLEKGLILSYIHTQLAIRNMEVVLVQLKALEDPDKGKLEFHLSKLKGAANKAYSVLEKNVKAMGQWEELQNDIDTQWGYHWDEIKEI